MSNLIQQPAFVDPRAELAADVYIGPFCVIGPDVKIGRGTRLENNVTVMGRVTIGEDNHIFPNVVIGADPQDISYRGTATQVVIGDRNVIREAVTINRASEKEEGITSLGHDNLLMAGTHIAHDCRLGNHIIIANSSLLGGHVRVHDYAALSGAVAVHHYVTIGSYSFVAGVARVQQDVPPFMLCEGIPARPRAVNMVALKRRQFSRDAIRALHEACRLLFFQQQGLDTARQELINRGLYLPEIQELCQFLEHSHQGRNGRSLDRRLAA
jgi:UDP-N-acetylglucosamine acyltransferase